MIKVLLVDDHALVRSGFRMILAKESDFDVVGEAGNGQDGLALVKKLKPDIVVLDLQLPDISGLEVVQRLQRAPAPPRVLAVTARDAQPMPRRVLEAGAAGFVTKSCEQVELVTALRRIARGERYISAEIAQSLALAALPGDNANSASPFAALSRRELDVCILIVGGVSTNEIGERLHLSPKTVSTYKYRLLEKLGLDSEVALVHLAVQHKLVEPGEAKPRPGAASPRRAKK